ncbi:MAG: cyclic nucleotide-binding domain-containing protein [Spirochaetes bacterium]|nr:cyclic nucleotide-binding domain-containing protein [Spirochaetota bacterium]
MEKKRFGKGELILQEGTKGNEMYVIISGKVKVFKTIDNKRIELAQMGPDDFFGEMSLFLQKPRSASIEAVTNCEILIHDQKSFVQVIQEDPDFALQVIKTMAGRLLDAHNVISKIEGEKKSLEIMYGKKD